MCHSLLKIVFVFARQVNRPDHLVKKKSANERCILTSATTRIPSMTPNARTPDACSPSRTCGSLHTLPAFQTLSLSFRTSRSSHLGPLPHPRVSPTHTSGVVRMLCAIRFAFSLTSTLTGLLITVRLCLSCEMLSTFHSGCFSSNSLSSRSFFWNSVSWASSFVI